MRIRAKKMAAVVTASAVAALLAATPSFAAGNAFGIDAINWTDEDWASIAMANDDTVDTGAVIRSAANKASEAVGYLYRGAAAKIISKGEKWTEIESGKVRGFVKNRFLAFGDTVRGLAEHYGEEGVIANYEDVNVFSGAEGEVKGTVSDRQTMGLIQDEGHWIAVQQGKDEVGYVSSEDVTRVLLVDTAVPADGDDMPDVEVTMTAEDLVSYGNQNASGDQSSDEGSDASYDDTYADSYEGSYEGGSGSYEYEEASYDGSYDSYSDGGNDASSGSGSYETYAVQTVSDDPYIQGLYEAFIEAQNAAMDCTSESDAIEKAQAATAAWNAYLTACSGTTSAAGGTSDSGSSYETASASSADSSTGSETVYDADAGSSDDSYASSDAAQTSAASGSSSDSSNSASSGTITSGTFAGYTDLDLLAAIIWCEAGNQPYDGMVAVGQVVMNRVASGSFPNTISEVLASPGQFTPYSSGGLKSALASGVNSTCYAAAQDAMNGAAPVPGTPLYFNTHSGSYKLGAHYFH